jgi:hypothetical protein
MESGRVYRKRDFKWLKSSILKRSIELLLSDCWSKVEDSARPRLRASAMVVPTIATKEEKVGAHGTLSELALTI